MRLDAYRRVSTDDQTASLEDQTEEVEEFCNSVDEFQYGDEHELVKWFEDEGKSGSILSVRRDGFREMIDHLNENEDIDGFVVWDFDRFGREPVDQMSVKFILEHYEVGRKIEVMQVDPWRVPYRAIPPVTTKTMRGLERPLDEWNNLFLFMTQAMMDMRELLEISHRTRRSLRLKEERNEPTGRSPRGLTTDKQLLSTEDGEEIEATMYLPADDNEDPTKNFVSCIKALNAAARDETTFYQAGREAGMPNPHGTVERMWERREEYKQAIQNAREHEEIKEELSFDPDQLYIGF